MLYTEFADLVREYTKTNTSTFTDARVVLLANAIIESMASDIEERKRTYFELEASQNINADQRKYAFAENILNNIKRVEVLLDNEDGTTWKKLSPMSLNTFPDPTDETSITAYFQDKNNAYALSDGWIYIWTGETLIDVANGLKLFYSIYPQKITTAMLAEGLDMSVPYDVDSFGIPRLIHELVARRVSIDYKTNRDKPMPLSAKELMYESDYQMALDRISNTRQTFQASVPVDDGSDY